jgi:hypothetical protein
MRDKDVLYVANASGFELGKFFALIGAVTSPVSSLLSVGVTTANSFGSTSSTVLPPLPLATPSPAPAPAPAPVVSPSPVPNLNPPFSAQR